jgi:hypothetical protein
MEIPQQKQLRVDLEHQLVKDLESMRDTLTHLSLTLQDLRFEVEVSQRETAAQQASDCIARSQSGQH